MKTLFVLRHAKAERESASGRDFDRRLAPRGWRDGEAVGRAMRERGLAPDSVIVSPAKRTAETMIAVERGFGTLAARFDERIYNAPVGRLIEVVRETNNSIDRLMILGHNPGMEELILRLSADDKKGFQHRVARGFPTAALAAIELPAGSWGDVGAALGRIAALIIPRELG